MKDLMKIEKYMRENKIEMIRRYKFGIKETITITIEK